MNVASNIPSPGLPVLGPDGRMSPVWFQFFMTLFRRTGDTQGTSADDQSLAPGGDSGLAEIVAQLFDVRDGVYMLPPAAPAVANDDQAPLAGLTAISDDLSRPEQQAAPQDVPSGRNEALEALVQRLITEIEAIRQGQQL